MATHLFRVTEWVAVLMPLASAAERRSAATPSAAVCIRARKEMANHLFVAAAGTGKTLVGIVAAVDVVQAEGTGDLNEAVNLGRRPRASVVIEPAAFA